MKKLVELCFLFFLFFVTAAQAQFMSIKVSSNTDNQGYNGVFYSLPRVVLQVDVISTKTISLPGPYANYARQVLGLTDFISKEEISYSIQSIHLSSFVEADPNAVYFLNLGDRSGKIDRNFLLLLQENGILKGMDEITMANQEARATQIELQKADFVRDFKYHADLNQVTRVDTIVRRMTVDTTRIEDVVFNRTSVEKSMEQRAQDAASMYMNIQKNRIELLSGYQEVSYPIQTLQMMNKELIKLESDYLALFKGKHLESQEKYSYFIVPEGDKSKQIYPVFKFSKENGVSDLASTSGERVNVMVQTNGITDVLKKQSSKDKVEGIFYRIPETARVWVNFNNADFSKETFIIPQLGVLQAIGTGKTIFSIDPKTGMLKAIEVK
ncbi:MAG TPA: hypothetical protein DCG69_11815 [Bacteroidales bacterium]|nr:hypothetical protein [Bacteroidales bacterium]